MEFRQYCSFIESIPEPVANDALGKLRYTAITPILTTIEVLPLTAMLNTTDPPKQFTATAYDQDGNAMPDVTVTWYSSNEAVGTIDANNGLFTAKAEGETIIEAESAGIKGTAHVTVSPVTRILTRIEVLPASETLDVGATRQFTATAYDQFGNEMPDVTVIWSRSDPTVGTIDANNGLFTAKAAGETIVGAESAGIKGTAHVTVSPVTRILTRIEVLPASETLDVGATRQFTATAYDQFGNEMPDVTVIWSRSDPTVGTIDANNGLFTAKAAGETIVGAESAGIKGTAHVTVSPVTRILTRIEVLPASETLDVGATRQFTATAYDQFGNEMPDVTVIWSRSDPTVGTIDANNGLFTAKAAGTTTIEAASGGKKGTAKVTVSQEKPILSRIVLSPASVTLEIGDEQQFHATAYDQNNNEMPDVTVIWSRSDPTVGTIDANKGLFTAKAAGTTTIEAASGGKKGTAKVTVSQEKPILSRIVLSPASVTLEIGDEQQFHATAYDQFGNEMPDATVIWSSSNETVGTIDANNGLFTAKAAGTTTIEAASGGKKGTAGVTVSQEKPILSRIELSPASVTLEVGDEQQFHATAYDQFGNEMPDATVIWSSSNETVGTIDANNGLFTAKAAGTTTIEAASGGKKGTANVTVENSPPVPSFTYTPSRPKEGETVTFNASASSDRGGHITKYEWDFGDGTTKKRGEIVTHTYTCVGIRTVKLKVTDNKGASNTTEKSIEVNRLQETQEIPLNGIVKFTEPGIKEVIPEIFISKPADGNITITIYNTSENEPIIEIETPESIKDSPVDITFNVSKKWLKENKYKKENVWLSCGSNDKRVKLEWIGTVDGYEQYKAILVEFPSQKYRIVGERESPPLIIFLLIIMPTLTIIGIIISLLFNPNLSSTKKKIAEMLIGLLVAIAVVLVLVVLCYYRVLTI